MQLGERCVSEPRIQLVYSIANRIGKPIHLETWTSDHTALAVTTEQHSQHSQNFDRGSMTQLGKIISGRTNSVIEIVGWESKDFSSNEAALFRKESSSQCF